MGIFQYECTILVVSPPQNVGCEMCLMAMTMGWCCIMWDIDNNKSAVMHRVKIYVINTL